MLVVEPGKSFHEMADKVSHLLENKVSRVRCTVDLVENDFCFFFVRAKSTDDSVLRFVASRWVVTFCVIEITSKAAKRMTKFPTI